MVWQLSGMPHLFDALSERVAEGQGAEMLAATRKRAMNYVAGLRASSSIVSMRLEGDSLEILEATALDAKLRHIEAKSIQTLSTELDTVFEKFGARVDQSHKRFLDRALESLLQHLEQNGENEVWQYSPDGLRMLLRTSYQVMKKNFTATCDHVFTESAQDLTNIYGEVFSVAVENFKIAAPASPEVRVAGPDHRA
jgi:hypothetical protein